MSNERKDDGGPAFPMVVTEYNFDACVREASSIGGMSLRDYFAGQALHSFMRLAYSSGGGWMQYATHVEEGARIAYAFADAMLEARKK
jgi:hypothetical protein